MKPKIATMMAILLVLLVGCTKGKVEERSLSEETSATEQVEDTVMLEKNEEINKNIENEKSVLKSDLIKEDDVIKGTLTVKNEASDEEVEKLKEIYSNEIKEQYKDVPVDIKVEREGKTEEEQKKNNPTISENQEKDSSKSGGEDSVKLTDLPTASLKVQVTPLNATQVVLMIEELPEEVAKASALTLQYDGKTFELKKSKTGRSFQHTFEVKYDVNDVKAKATLNIG